MGIRRRKTTDNRSAPDDAGLDEELAELRAVLARYPAGATLTFGAPSRCPECGDYGLVGHVTHDTGRCTNNCRVCRRDWVITRRALRAHRDAPVTPPMPIGRGVLYEALLAAEEEPPVAEVRPEPQPEPQPEPAAQPEPQPEVEPAPPAPVAEAPSPATVPVAEPQPVAPPPQPVVDLSGGATSGALSLLVVEDNPFDLTVVEDLLEPYLSSGEVVLTHCPTRAEAEHAAAARSFDVVLLDLDLPDSRGLTTLLEWQHLVPSRLPLVALSESVDAELIRGARALGVSQVIHRPQLEQLATQGPGGQDRLYKLLRKTAATGAAATNLAAGPRF